MRFSWASRSIFFSVFQSTLAASLRVRESGYTRIHIYISAPASCHQTADGGLVKREGGHVYGCEGVWEPLQGFGGLCGSFRHSGDASSGSNFHFGIFRSKRHFRSHRFFSAFTSPQSTPLNFFVFQNPAVCYFAHIASIAENKNFEICVFRGHHARIFLYFKVPWRLRYVSVKFVQHTYKYIYIPIKSG